MSQNVELITREQQKALIIKDSVGTLKLAKVMGPAYAKIMDYLKGKNVELCTPFTSYHVGNWEETVNMSGLKMFFSLFTKKWDIEMGFEVPANIDGSGEIQAITLPAGKYLQTMHIGPYNKVGESYKKIYKYAKEQKHTLGNCSYEFYLNDPRETPQNKLETQILVPVS